MTKGPHALASKLCKPASVTVSPGQKVNVREEYVALAEEAGVVRAADLADIGSVRSVAIALHLVHSSFLLRTRERVSNSRIRALGRLLDVLPSRRYNDPSLRIGQYSQKRSGQK